MHSYDAERTRDYIMVFHSLHDFAWVSYGVSQYSIYATEFD